MNKIHLFYKKIKGVIFFSTVGLKRKVNIFLGKPIFYVIGDSHALCFQHEKFIIKHIGPATAYKLIFDKTTSMGKEKIIKYINKIYKNKPINIIFVFGELDVRIHINKITKQRNMSIDKAIEQTVVSYMDFLKYLKNKYAKLSIYVFNVLPQGEQENIYNYPFYASRKKRSKIAERVNDSLKKYTNSNNFSFIYIYDKLVDKYGNRKKEYIFDDVHFNRKIISYILDKI